MVFLNYSTMQMVAKIVYYGPGLCGKTTNLKEIYRKTSARSRGEMVSLETETDRTLFFDLLPMDVGIVGGFKTKFQLYTVPGQVFYNSTRKLVLRGVDGIVFVADSQKPMLEANRNSYENLVENLSELGLSPEEVPLVFQFNKRDLPNVLSIEEMNRTLNVLNRPYVEAAALTGNGVFETLKEISKQTLVKLRVKALDDRKNAEDEPEEIREELQDAPNPHELMTEPEIEERFSEDTLEGQDSSDLDFDTNEAIEFEEVEEQSGLPEISELEIEQEAEADSEDDLGDFDLDFEEDDLDEDSLDLTDFDEFGDDENEEEAEAVTPTVHLEVPINVESEESETSNDSESDMDNLLEQRLTPSEQEDTGQEMLRDQPDLDGAEFITAEMAEEDEIFEVPAEEDVTDSQFEIEEEDAGSQFDVVAPISEETDSVEPEVEDFVAEMDDFASDSVVEPEPASDPFDQFAVTSPPSQPIPDELAVPKVDKAKKDALSSSIQELEDLATQAIKTKSTRSRKKSSSVDTLLTGLVDSGSKSKSERIRIQAPADFETAQLNCVLLDGDENVVHTHLAKVEPQRTGPGKAKIRVTFDIEIEG